MVQEKWVPPERRHSGGSSENFLTACKFSLSFPWASQPDKAPDVPQNLCQPSKNNINVQCWVKSYPGSTELNAGGCEVGRTRFCSFRISHKPTQSSHKSSDIWSPAFIPDLPPTVSLQSFKQCFCLLPTPSLVFYSFWCSGSLGKSLLQLHPGLFIREKQTEQAPVDGEKSLLQAGTAAPWTQAGAITALNAKDNVQQDTAKDSREMGVGNRYSLGARWKRLGDLIQSNSSPHTSTGTQNRQKWWQLGSFSENEIPFTQDRALPCAENVNCSLKHRFNVFQRCLAVNKRFLLFTPSLMCVMKLFFFLKRTSVTVLHNNFCNYILRVSSVNNLLLKTCTVALSVSISQQQPTSISIFKSSISKLPLWILGTRPSF